MKGDVVTMRVLLFPVTVGVTLFGMNEQDAPRGRVASMQERVTLEGIPSRRVAVMLFDPDPPGKTVIFPEFDRE